MIRMSLALALVGVLSSSPREEASSPFDYDRDAPLDLREVDVEKVDSAVLRDLSYASPRGGRVPAYLVEPGARGEKNAGIVFVHWGQGNRTEFVSEAIHYAGAGAISLLIDAPHMRRDFQGPRDGYVEPEGERDGYIQLVVDARRGFDLLLLRDDVDPARLGYVGHSLGATWGGALAGVDRRVRAFVLVGGLPNLTDPGSSFPEDIWSQIRDAYSEEQIEKYREVLGAVSPSSFIGRAEPGSVFLQFARYDRFISDAAAKVYAEAAREPEVRWYVTSHEFNDGDSLRDRIDWLTRKLELQR